MNLTTSQYLRKAWEFIDTPSKWTKGAMHRYYPHGRRAHCAVGALQMASHWAVGQGMTRRVAFETEQRARNALRETIPQLEPGLSKDVELIPYNDRPSTDHELMNQVWDKTVAGLEEIGE